jgi:predicted amidophosphoribosyltransferase
VSSPRARVPSSPAARLGRDLLDLVLPAYCAACGLPGALLCPSCGGHLRAEPALVPGGAGRSGLPVVSAARYGGVARAVLLAHKDGTTPLVAVLAPLLAAAVRAVSGPQLPVVLVPAPSARRAVRERGHDHALRLARRTAALLRNGGQEAAAVPALRQARRVADQGGLSAASRRANLAGALAARRRSLRSLAGAPVIVVDDVCATGSTLAACAEALRERDVEPLAAAVVTATGRRGDSSGRGTPNTPLPFGSREG